MNNGTYDTSYNTNKIDTKDTSYNEDKDFSSKSTPNRETRRKENKKKYTGNQHEMNIGRISLSGNNIICLQKEKKKNFNNFIKGKVKK